ncbi:MAG: GNAT family N-acetyltransferase [Bacteroidales bacterium]|nr:GNAT family N-acetyltransferase [Bacteroidales bacterium]
MVNIKDTYRIEKFTHQDNEQLVLLMKNCFNQEVPAEYFDWKYFKNPAGASIGFVAKTANNEIVAFEGLMPEIYSLNGEQRIVFHSTDTMTHSEHRGKGLYTKIANAGFDYLRQEGKLFELGFGGAMSTPIIQKFGWKTICFIRFYFKTYFQSFFNNLFFSKRLRTKDFYIQKIDHISEIMPVLKACKTTAVHKVISEEVYSWKIANPRFNYQVFGIYDTQKNIKGYVVFYIQNNKIMLFDMRFMESKSIFEKKLFLWLDQQVVKNKYTAIVTFSQENVPYYNQLKKNGFINNKMGLGPLGYNIPFMIYCDDDTYEKIKDPKCWEIIPLCHDSF